MKEIRKEKKITAQKRMEELEMDDRKWEGDEEGEGKRKIKDHKTNTDM